MSKRLKKEFQNICDLYDAELINDNYNNWHIALNGPDGTPYFGGTFLINISFSEKYPFEAPTIIFETKIYHPNINHKGEICIRILKDEWTPSNTIKNVMKEIENILINPNPEDPLVAEIGTLYITNYEKYKEKALDITLKYAM